MSGFVEKVAVEVVATLIFGACVALIYGLLSHSVETHRPKRPTNVARPFGKRPGKDLRTLENDRHN